MASKPNFGRFLVDHALLTEQELEKLDGEASSKKVSLPEALIERGILSPDTIAKCLASFYNVEYHSGPLEVDGALAAEFPLFTLRRYRIVPLAKTSQELVVAVANPGNFLAIDELKRATKLFVRIICTTDAAIAEALQRIQEEAARTGKATQTRKASAEPTKKGRERHSKREPVQGTETPGGTGGQHEASGWPKPPTPAPGAGALKGEAADRIDQVIHKSVMRGASDIHFEPQGQIAVVRERIDGVLYEADRVPNDLFGPMLSRLKLLAGMDIVEKRLSQDGRFRFAFSGGHTELRASTLPTVHGEKMVLRVLRSDEKEPTLAMLDVGKQRLEMIRRITEMTDGLVLVAGPTGSGKTTTIYAILAALDRKSQNLITVEDPVEYQMTGANQVQVNARIGMGFGAILPSILRQDPDILMVGEIREEETAQMVMRAAISGHLVFSTIHAPTALQTVTRLMDIGVQSHMVAASLKAVISQRLLRKLCPSCKEAHSPTAADRRALGLPPDVEVKLYSPKGCKACHGIGYSGRFAAMEVLLIDDALNEAIVNRDRHAFEKIARAAGFTTMKDHATERVFAGETSVAEMVANCP